MSAVNVLQPPRLAGLQGPPGPPGANGVSPDPTALSAATTAAQSAAAAAALSASGSATAASTATTQANASFASATASSNSAAAASTSAGNSAGYATASGTSATASASSATASSNSASASATSAIVAQNWASQFSGTVDGTSLSAKGYAQVAQNWASQLSGTVDGTNYSAKQYAQQAAQSAISAAGAGVSQDGSSFTVGNFAVFSSTTGGKIHDGGAPAAVATSGSASDLTKGTLPAAQLPTNGVANTNLAQMPARTVKANVTGTAANAADVTPSALLDTISSTQGTLLYRSGSSWVALSPGSAGQALLSGGTAANPVWSSAVTAFPVSKVVAKSSAYPILASDVATMFDLTGSFALTLPAASGASLSAPLWYHFRKRDGSGQCTVVPAGSDTIEGSAAPIALYQERATLVSFGSGWVFPPGGREKVVYVVMPGTAFSGVSSIALTTGFDADVAEVDVNIDSVTTSAAGVFSAQIFQAGAYVTSAYSYNGSDSSSTNGSDYSVTGTAIPFSARGTVSSTNTLYANIALRNIQSAIVGIPSVEVRGTTVSTNGASSSFAFDTRAYTATAAAIGGIKLYPASGTASGAYSQRITRA